MAVRFLGLVWLIAVLFRLAWVCVPQTGYIHPDEFFQATEITAGDLFGFKHTRTWEFNKTFPARSAVFPYVFTGIPFYILKMFFSVEAITTRTLVVAPRLCVSAATLVIDLSVYKICHSLRIDPQPSLCLLGSSFVTLVFYTRTFSNTVEAILFALLLHLVVSSRSNGNMLQTTKDIARYFAMGAVVGVGIWIRPTFVAFACVPLLWWLLDMCGLKWASDISIIKLIGKLFRYCICLGLGSLVTVSILILTDSHYFGYLQKGKFVFTPVNLVSYNLDTSLLKQHGLHPRITHFLVNMPLLYGPLALAFYASIIRAGKRRTFVGSVRAFISRRKGVENNNLDEHEIYSVKCMVFCSVVVPVALVSLVQHQEPRYINPVLIPLVILFSRRLVGSSASPVMLLSWCIWNILGCVLFGILHQGGAYPCLAHLQQYLYNARSQNINTTYHVTFYHTYMPPQHLLAWPMSGHQNERGFHHNLTLYDLKGGSDDSLKEHLEMISKMSRQQVETSGTKQEVYKTFLLKGGLWLS